MRWLNNVRMAPKLIGSFVLVAALAGVVGGVGVLGMDGMQSRSNWITGNSVPSLVHLLNAKFGLAQSVRYTRGALIATKRAQVVSYAAKAQSFRTGALREFRIYQALPYNSAQERTMASRVSGQFTRWMPVNAHIQQLALEHTPASRKAGILLSTNGEKLVVEPLATSIDALVTLNMQAIQRETTASRADQAMAVNELAGATALVMLLALALGLLIARSIARPLAEVQRAAESVARICISNLAAGITALAQGDLTVAAHVGTTPPAYHSRDEIGQTAEVVRRIVGTVQQTVGAYETARLALQRLVSQVAETARQVGAGSDQLAQASSQIGQASGQIARSIEEVARGASEQSRHATEIMGRMMSLTAAHDSAQPGALAKTERAVGELRRALDLTTGGASTVTHAAARATTTAQQGSTAVGQTLQSIEEVREAVLQSAEQVQALGRGSAEIGQIVAAIDDIAEQTNLLALNAAIEAARAGEHGKGFTVVAAEVRKLAERASGETKEITQRIAAIQAQVAAVVGAMEMGSAKVEQSAQLGKQARVALAEILDVVEETNAQAQKIGGAVEGMTQSVGEVSGAAAQVTRVTDEIAEAIESITAVSEQSAAGAEEVSASTEEQSASTEELEAGAQELAAQAAHLQAAVDRFRVAEVDPAAGGDAAPSQYPFADEADLTEHAA